MGFPAYEFIITGGSDRDGFPHRSNIQGAGRRKYLLSGGIGYKVHRKGRRIRKTVRGNILSETSYQINMKVSRTETNLSMSLIEGSSSE